MLQLPLHEPYSDWHPPSLADLPSWEGARRVGLDLETHDEKLTTLGPGVRRDDAEIVGVAFAIENGPAHYLPIAHAHGANLDREKVFQYLADQAAVYRGDIVGANLGYEDDFLQEAGVHFQPHRWRDVQIAEPLLDENQWNYGLDAIAKRHGMPGKDETHLKAAAEDYRVDPKKGLWMLPARHVGAYAIQDVRLPLKLIVRQERMLEAQGLWDLYDLECRVLPVLIKMRRHGVRIDFDRLDQVEAWSIQEEEQALSHVTHMTGVKLVMGDTTKPKQLARALAAVGVTVPKTTTGQPSVKTEVLAEIDHKVARAIERAKRFNKLRTTFVKSIRSHAVNGRVHCTFNQLKRSKDDGSSAGTIARLSSSNPNLQQQPSRDKEIAPRWRSIYVPDEGKEWACLDFSQQEPRWLVHFAESAKCFRADQAGERYRQDPNTDNHSMMAGMVDPNFVEAHYLDKHHPRHKACDRIRKNAKTIFLGLCYGMGQVKLCRKLGLPTEQAKRRGRMVEVAGPEGRALFEQFDSRVPFIRELARRAEARANERGFITTVLGRRCRFPEKDGERQWTRKALNRLIQGSSADQTKKAMVDADAAGFQLQLQVHDELDLSVSSRTEAEQLATIMRDSVSCLVPHKVDVETGPSWGEVE